MSLSPQEVTQLLLAWRKGDKTALDKLIPLVYEELHRLARRYMARQAPGHTLQTTALINEVYMQLIDQSHIEWQNRAHFFAVCATSMRNILVDHFRRQLPKVTLSEGALVSPGPDVDVMALDEALGRLAALDKRQSQVVELRFFGGLAEEEVAEVLDVCRLQSSATGRRPGLGFIVNSAEGEAVTPERYQQINELLDLVLKLEPSQRPAYLDQVCAGDEALHREIESLLTADAQASIGGFLEVPAAAKFARIFASNQSAKAMSEKPMILNNRYSIERELGRGGFGVVYLAHDLKLHSRRVVVKVLQEEIGHNDYWKRKFRQEIEALTRFENPHIVGIVDTGELPSGDSFFVMAYVEGVNLRSVMKGEGMEFARVVRLVRQIGQALSYAHDRFVYHRDLKPGNIMLQKAEDEEFIILIDFGIATVKESQPATRSTKTAITGTPEYMAPEQIRGEPSAASDIYALGVIAYEMLTGRQPFAVPRNERGEPLLAELYKVQQAGVKVRPKDLRSDLPEAAQAAILKALSFDPKDRHPRARDFSEALARALTGEKAVSLSEMPTYSDSTTVDILDEPQFAEVVISYCAQDLSRALQIAERLKAAGVAYWMADHGHEVTLDDRSETIQAVKQCKVVLLLCSDAALRSTLVKQDMQLAWSYERPFLPLLVEPIDFLEQAEYWFEGQHWIEMMDAPLEQWLPMVLRALANVGVWCPGVNLATLEGVPVVEPTRLDRSLKSLRSVARFTDQIWPLPAERMQRNAARFAVRGLGAPQNDVQHGHRLGSQVCLSIELDRAGHLLLLDEGPEGIIYCLCPSWFAPDTRLPVGCSYLPQSGSRYDSFVATGKPGREHLLAIITDEPLGLDWLTADPRKEPARILKQADIHKLLIRLRGLEGSRWMALSTYFDVIT